MHILKEILRLKKMTKSKINIIWHQNSVSSWSNDRRLRCKNWCWNI